MQLATIGLRKMGASMVSRLLQGVVFEMKPDRVNDVANKGATGAAARRFHGQAEAGVRCLVDGARGGGRGHYA